MKKLLETLEECGMGEAMPPMQQGTPVSMNVSINASGMDHVADLIALMKNAGLDAKPMAPDMMPMRMDMERLRDIVDGPMIPGEGADNRPNEEYMDTEELMAGGNDLHHEKHPSDIRLKDPSAFSDIEEGGFKDQEIELQDALYDFAQEIQKGMHTYDNVVDELNGMFDDVKASNDKISMNAFKVLRSLEPEDFGPGEGGGPNRASSVAQDAMDIIDGSDDDDYKPLEGYDNEPDEKYSDHNTMLKDLSGGLNREKKMYKKAQDGDNAMAAESIKARLLQALAEKKAKPDFLDMDKDGNKKEPMKKAIADKKKKK